MASKKVNKEWGINKPKHDKKLIKHSKAAKDGVGKHKRVRSDANTVASKMFSDTLQSSHVGLTNTNSKKLLKTVTNKTNTVYSYHGKKPSTATTTRIFRKEKKPVSRGQYMSEKNTFKKPKGYKIMAKKSAENSPTITKHYPITITDSSGRPPTTFKKVKINGHIKNSMSTSVKKKESYFYTQEEELHEDIDEFPVELALMAQQRLTD